MCLARHTVSMVTRHRQRTLACGKPYTLVYKCRPTGCSTQMFHPQGIFYIGMRIVRDRGNRDRGINWRTRVNIALVSGLGLVVAVGLAFLSRRKVERLTRWVDNPAYDKLGTISRECLNDYVRQGR